MIEKKIVALITCLSLLLSTMGVLVPSAFCITQTPIILPFWTSWETTGWIHPQGRQNSVDQKTDDFSSPSLVPRDSPYEGVSTPPDDMALGYRFGSCFLVAEGQFGSSHSYCYFNLFDMTAYSDYTLPIKIRPHTFLSIWHYHQGSIADCMIDAKLYNKQTGQWWTLRDFNYNGKYIVDQNGTRIHPAHRSNDPLNSWQFANFDLSIIYENDPENWYITKIWIGFDNENDGKTGFARTYFDMLHITYGVSNQSVDSYVSNDPLLEGDLMVTMVSASVIAWKTAPSPSGYDLGFKVYIYAFSNETWFMPGIMDYDHYWPWTLSVDANRSDAQARVEPPPTGVNLIQVNATWTSPKVWEYVVDGCILIAGIWFPEAKVLSAANLARKFMGLANQEEAAKTYTWPHAAEYFPDNPESIAGEVHIDVQGLPSGSYGFSFTCTAGFDSFYSAGSLYYKSVPLNIEWTTNPDELPVSLSISASSGGTTNPAPGTYTYNYGSTVTVTASAYSGYYFSYWNLDGATVYSNPITVTMNSDHTLTAYFQYSGGGGGCPYVYTWDGQQYVMDNNLLPASEMSNGADVEDRYRLEQPLVPMYQVTRSSVYSLQIREFEHEHDYFDQVKLLAVDHSSNVNVAVSPYGEILTYSNPASAIFAVDDNGVDVLSQLSSVDGNYYEGYNGSYIILNFGNVNSENAKLVLRTDRPPLKMSIHIQVQDPAGNWTDIATIIPRTYWATDIIDVSSYLPSRSNTELKVRLYFTASHKIDYVGLDTTPQASVKTYEANLISAIHSTQGNVKPLLMKNDQTYAELTPGQQIQLTFLLPNNRNEERTFILYAEGHYSTIAP